MGFSEQRHGLRHGAILESDEKVLPLTRDEGESLTGSYRGVGAEGDEGVDDELKGGEEELVVTLGGGREEAVKVCEGRKW